LLFPKKGTTFSQTQTGATVPLKDIGQLLDTAKKIMEAAGKLLRLQFLRWGFWGISKYKKI
jgi:hypothetical protein